jgi:hypothetical protein
MHDVSGKVTPRRIYTGTTVDSPHFLLQRHYSITPNITSPTQIPEEVYYPGTEPVYEFKKGGVLKAERGASLPQVVIPDSVKQKISAATQIQAPINKGIADLNAATKAKIQSGIGTSSGNGTLVGGNGTSGSGSLGRDID